MLEFVTKFFAAPAAEVKSWKLDKANQVRIAFCALLVHAARSDEDFSAQEKAHIIDLLSRQLQLDSPEVEKLLLAAEAALKTEQDIWVFTDTLNQNLSLRERETVMETVWRTIYTDKNMNPYENYIAHKLARLLRLSHQQLIAAKMKVKAELAEGI